MFKFLRSKAKVFYWVIAASFVLFIFLAWGMQMRGGREDRRGRGDEIGSVNGMPITVQEWQSAYQNYLARLRQQAPDRTLTSNQRASIEQQVWDGLVRDRIVSAEVARLKLSATPDEILDILKNDPPPELLANYKDENGNPDWNAYRADLANPARDWSAVENYLRLQIPRQKLQQIIVAPAVVTEQEVREAYLQQTARAVAEYIGVPFADLEEAPAPDESAVADWYGTHPGLYHRDASATVKLVVFAKEPSEADRQEVRQLALDIKSEIERGDIDFAEAARVYSQDEGTADNGGDLGTFDRNRMVAPFTEAAFSLPVGKISDPVETDFGYHLIEVLDRTEKDGEVVEVHARHILLKIEPGDDTLMDIEQRASDFRDAVTAADFVATAEADSLDLRSPEPFREGQNIPGLANSLRGSYYAHRHKPGTISGVLESDEAYYVLLVTARTPAGPAPLDEVHSQVVTELNRQRDRDRAAEKLNPAVGEVQLGKAMADVAEERGLAHAVTDTFTVNGNVPDIGYATAFNRVAVLVDVGTLVPEVETNRGLYALRTLWKSPFDEADYAARKNDIRAGLLGQKQNKLLEAWFDDQIAAADIVDNRDILRGES